MEILRLTVVDLDLVKSSILSIALHKYGGVKATNVLYEDIEEIVFEALKSVEYHKIMSLGGDGYRISFEDINHAYDFVINFSKLVDDSNKEYEQDGRYKRTFRISAVTGKVFYNQSKLGLDIIRGDILRRLNRLLTAALPGWFYIDEATFDALPAEKKECFFDITSIKGKSSKEENFNAYCCQIIDISTSENLQSFEFPVVTVDVSGKKIRTRKYKALSFVESLGEGIEIEMVKIPGGTFKMGSPENELKHRKNESPQHQVTVQPFYIGKYQVTQEQWKAVANLPQVKKRLKPEPCRFKGKNLPVERVSWHEAVEFCARLSKHTGRKYRLPSEAEWEYACRAGTTTPFHFGETITSELANYNANYTYGDAPEGGYHQETTPVGSFGVANAFGLYDMHGNVWEWCLDDWHQNYKGAPTDGSAWFNNIFGIFSKPNPCLRGGSWLILPDYCRSASRDDCPARVDYYYDIGFRVVCAVGRT
ncbi:MAG: formylglycine-generating enzyme family protein [Cyanobacteria bacterium P01_A01_bin.84]